MDLLSISYALFVAVSALLFQLAPVRFRPTLLVAASLLFCGFQSLVSAAILLAASVAVFLAARSIDSLYVSSARRQVLLAVMLVTLVGYLVLIRILPLLRAHGHAQTAGQILIVLGISYYTFKLMGYLIDVYWRRYPAWSDPVLFLAFATFFPLLPAGPIQRPGDFCLPGNGEETARRMAQGLRRILWGLLKKTVVADQLASIVGYVDGMQPRFSNMLWIAACAYALEIYFDFAALTDIAIGTANLFGIRCPENFNFPLFAPSISQFWRRWHMSLTLWFTDYVFTPLRMSMRSMGNAGLTLSILACMVLIGLWHGIGLGFLIFGLVHGAYLIVDALSASWRRAFYRRHPMANRLTSLVGPLLVFAMVAFALVFFRAVTMANIAYQMHHIWDGLAAPAVALHELYFNYSRRLFVLTCLATAAALGIELLQYRRQAGDRLALRLPGFEALPAALRLLAYYAGIAIVFTLHPQPFHFIYVRF